MDCQLELDRRRSTVEQEVNQVDNVGEVHGAVTVGIARSDGSRTAFVNEGDKIEDIGGIDYSVAVRIKSILAACACCRTGRAIARQSIVANGCRYGDRRIRPSDFTSRLRQHRYSYQRHD